MFILKDKKTNEILMTGTHKDVCRYFAVEREFWKAAEEKDPKVAEMKKKALTKGSKDKAYKQECEHLYEIIEVAHYDRGSVKYCWKSIVKKIKKTS